MIIVYISGIDGCGKTTQSQLLVDWLRQQGHTAEYQWLRWEPSLRRIFDSVRKITGKRRDTDRAQQTQRADENARHSRWKNLKRNLFASSLFRSIWLWYATRDYYHSYRSATKDWNSDYVVLDRYLLDFVVDQALNFSMDPSAFLARSEHTVLARMTKPTYSVFIDIPAKVGYARKLDGTPLDYLREREELYRNIPDATSVLHVNGERPPEEIHADIRNWLQEKSTENDDRK